MLLLSHTNVLKRNPVSISSIVTSTVSVRPSATNVHCAKTKRCKIGLGLLWCVQKSNRKESVVKIWIVSSLDPLGLA